ncbi:transposase [Pediococcus pentosaceus]|uniref:transposase n=1 Tax=Pediococcus pentosaceus TaxID=1255 RepID=UPI0022773B1B|nr:transposase [Pediococcus pentosaceus]
MGDLKYLPAMMLKILLCAYIRKACSGRKIQQMIEENIAMMWLIGDADGAPSYRTINRFRTSLQMTKLIQKAFVCFRQLLVDNAMIDNKVFIDGTKINANSNKYSFVWRKSSEKYEQQFDEKLIQNQVDTVIREEDTITRLEIIDENITHEIGKLNQKIENEKVKALSTSY